MFGHYLQSGLPDRAAKFRALIDVEGYLASARSSGIRALSAGSEQSGRVNEQRPDSMKSELRRYLDERLQFEGVRVGRTTLAEVLKERKQRVAPKLSEA